MITASVIIPTYNSRHLLDRALDGLRAQTLPPEELEVIVVDDGSTDDTWPYLQELAADWPQLIPVHEANSGGPSRPRNIGLRRARGRYVFFHDADDWMAPNALSAMAASADRLHSDVVVGRVRLIAGKREVSLIRPAEDADLMRDKVWTTLSAQKLFRRSFLARLQLEFWEDMVQGEDQVFVAEALLSAGRVTTLTDDDYYFRLRTRSDGSNLSLQPQTLRNKLLTSTRLTRLVTEHVEANRRPAYLRRVMLKVLAPGLAAPFMRADETERAAALAELQTAVLPHLAREHLEVASEEARLRLLLAARGSSSDLVALNKWLARRKAGEPLPAALSELVSDASR